MTGRNARRKHRGVWTALLTVLGLFLTACAKNAPQDVLKPEGPLARQADNLFRPVFWIAVVIFFLVEGMLVFALWRFRRRSDADIPKQTHGNRKLEILWTIIPAALLAGIAVPTVLVIFDQAERPVGAGVVRVKVTAHQWWWEYEYTDIEVAGGGKLKTANELVMPTGRWVALDITSQDVIHSFWVPKLGGKQDAVPNELNFLKLQADKPGVYEGQCAEFCALSHANMRLRAIALPPADFDAWVQRQVRPATIPASGQEAEGATLFNKALPNAQGASCINCHTIRGFPLAVSPVGPDLTHFADRTTFAGSMLEMNANNIADWLRDPPGIKPGSFMPDYNLTEAEIDALVAFLQSLS